MLRRVIYTTNSIESLNYQLRKVTKNRGHFPSDEAVWTARCFSDSACFVLQAAFFRSRKSLSASSGVRYPRAE